MYIEYEVMGLNQRNLVNANYFQAKAFTSITTSVWNISFFFSQKNTSPPPNLILLPFGVFKGPATFFVFDNFQANDFPIVSTQTKILEF